MMYFHLFILRKYATFHRTIHSKLHPLDFLLISGYSKTLQAKHLNLVYRILEVNILLLEMCSRCTPLLFS